MNKIIFHGVYAEDKKRKTDKDLMVAFDLYQLRYIIKNKWYDTHDVLRDYLFSRGHEVKYEKEEMFFNGYRMSEIHNALVNIKKKEEEDE